MSQKSSRLRPKLSYVDNFINYLESYSVTTGWAGELFGLKIN